ncbi:MAG: MATE family efflux transporter, partial [Ostreibacterium sp.]
MTSQSFVPPSYRYIIALSLPIILSNATVPLQGLIDVAIIGHLDSPDYLSSVGLATQLFSLLLVSFNFLQYSSSGLSAQAIGVGDTGKLKRVLYRALLIAVGIGVLLITMQSVWLRLGEWFFAPQGRVGELFADYFYIRIWGAPIELANYALLGWFAGQGKPGAVLRQQLLVSVSNVIFNLLFVVGLGYGVMGVALGTVLANLVGMAYVLLIVKQTLVKQGEEVFPVDWQGVLVGSLSFLVFCF